MKQSKIVLEINPVAKPRMTRSDKWKKRSVVINYWKYKSNLRVLALRNKIKITSEIDVVFILKMPNSWSKNKRSLLNNRSHRSRPDLDNLLKGLQDALMVEDSGIYRIKAEKYWGYKGKIIFNNPI